MKRKSAFHHRPSFRLPLLLLGSNSVSFNAIGSIEWRTMVKILVLELSALRTEQFPKRIVCIDIGWFNKRVSETSQLVKVEEGEI